MNQVKTKVMVSRIGHINIKPSSNEDQCGICCRKTMANAALCKSSGNWMHGRYTKIKGVTNIFAIDFNYGKCKGCHKNVDDLEEKLHEDVKTMTYYLYLGVGINSGDESEAAVTSRTRLGDG